jgi:hypothetical protein
VGQGKGAGRREPFWAEGRVWPRLEKKEGRERREGGVWEIFFFKTLFKLTFQSFEIELFSKHSNIFKTFLKAFKTSHKQIIKPCIQIMMHKHLLLLNY